MKIIQILSGKIWGGAEQYVLDLGLALRKVGHSVDFLALDCEAVKDRLGKSVDYEVITSKSVWNPWAVMRLSKIFQESDADIIHIHDTSFVPIVSAAKCLSGTSAKIVLTRHIARASRVFFIYRHAFKNLHRIIFVSELSKRLWISANTWMPHGKMVVIHNSIPDTGEDSTTESLRERFNIGKDIPLLVFTGRIRKSKGCAVLIKALASISRLPFSIVFIGVCKPADYHMKLTALAKEYGIEDRVKFYGFSDKVRSLIKDADIGVAPSIVREACPLSPMEFMKAGKCVIASNNGAQPEYISSGENGLLVSPGNHTQLADAIRIAIENPECRKSLGKNASEYFRLHMNYDIFISRIVSEYESQ